MKRKISAIASSGLLVLMLTVTPSSNVNMVPTAQGQTTEECNQYRQICYTLWRNMAQLCCALKPGKCKECALHAQVSWQICVLQSSNLQCRARTAMYYSFWEDPSVYQMPPDQSEDDFSGFIYNKTEWWNAVGLFEQQCSLEEDLFCDEWGNFQMGSFPSGN